MRTSETVLKWSMVEDEGYDLSEHMEDVVDMVDKPAHYNNGGIECIDYLKDNMSWEGYTGYLTYLNCYW